ncbi:hypothetical protein N7532_008582 [Penicillium argentinense]|uniref:Smr domain-containing protein n=1 Tax=Penicillium argentinense TaxID=1131581 RepID=A0A9W9EXM8_9EURO|nr:uncharacterized protein N7532_008582 [Penicillium argentinense]KAJ5089898.1 hypothetical protein N7532_008582 [Penicillium argentinense]
MADADDILRSELEQEYCPPLDSALFAALISDFTLGKPEDVNALRATLDCLKESAQLQENDPFDPSGTANEHTIDGVNLGGVFSDSGTSVLGGGTLHTSTDATTTSLRSQLSPGEDEANPNIAYTVRADGRLELTSTTIDDSVSLLAAMFPSVSRLEILQCLKKSNNDIDRSMDVLLNLTFFNESQAAGEDSQIFVPKGIDGFQADNTDIGRQKGRKQKRNKKQKAVLSATSSPEGVSTPNKWETGKADIEFLCSCIPDITREKIASTYHAKGASLRATVKALALADLPEIVEVDKDPAMMEHVTELLSVYPTIPKSTLVGLLRLTGNMVTPANELAAVLLRQPTQAEVSELIKFTAAPLNLENDNENSYSRPSHQYKESSFRNHEYEDMRASANAYFAASSAAHMQAAQAARRSKSNHLYGGASAYYRQVGQEQRERAMNQLAAASDRLVDRQSSACDLDLHGVTVENAKRIVRERVAAWWDSLGDTKYIRGGGIDVHGGYKIITGIGRHSQDGTSRLGPAVGKMLISEGWRVRITPGSLIVLGAARR